MSQEIADFLRTFGHLPNFGELMLFREARASVALSHAEDEEGDDS